MGFLGGPGLLGGLEVEEVGVRISGPVYMGFHWYQQKSQRMLHGSIVHELQLAMSAGSMPALQHAVSTKKRH